jgi:hypothetical protein
VGSVRSRALAWLFEPTPRLQTYLQADVPLTKAAQKKAAAVAAAETAARDKLAARREAADAAAELKAQANPGTPAAWEASYKVNTHMGQKRCNPERAKIT